MPTNLKRTLIETVTENLASAFDAVSEIQSYSISVATERGKQDNNGKQIWTRLFQWRSI